MTAERARVVVVGGGPAGSSCAIHLALAGFRPVVLEKAEFPRFHIGESLTGESGNLLREMGLEPAMLRISNPVKYGVHIYGPSGRHWYWFPVKRRDPKDGLQDTFTWQVRRSTFDTLLLDRARELGAQVRRAQAVAPVLDSASVTGVRVVDPNGTQDTELACDVLIDASGQATFLANNGVTSPKERGGYDRQVAIYGHFIDARRDDGEEWGNTVLFFRASGLWGWFIPIDEQVTSIGLVVSGDYYRSRDEPRLDFLLRELREFNPELARRTAQAKLVSQAYASSNYSYRIDRFSGPNWLCVGDAHRFIDPLFSFGVNVALAEGRQAARAVARYLGEQVADPERPFAEYERWSEAGIDVCQTVLDGFTFHSFKFGMIHSSHHEDFIDLLAGRVWDDPDYHGLALLREAIERRNQECADAAVTGGG